MLIDRQAIRQAFPSLASGAVFLDNPGGAQVPAAVIEAISRYLTEHNANQGGAFTTSVATDEMLAATRQALADFLNADDPRQIVFGPNMTSLAWKIAHAVAPEFEAGDEILVTRLDHDANIAPWRWVAEQRGCQLRWLDFDPQDCTLRIDQLDELLTPRTRWAAIGYASNAVGTINPVAHIIQRAHQVGARCFVDAVHYAPHGPIDVHDLDCDFLALSMYKVYGPHVGVLYGKLEHLEQMRAHKVRPAPAHPPGKFETGTQNHEGLAGTLATLDFLAQIPLNDDALEFEANGNPQSGDRRQTLARRMLAIRNDEMQLGKMLIEQLAALPGVRCYGLLDPRRIDRRVPTVSFTVAGMSPRTVAEALARLDIYVWDGNFYALAVTERLGLEEKGGLIRVGLGLYNHEDDIARFVEALQKIVARVRP